MAYVRPNRLSEYFWVKIAAEIITAFMLSYFAVILFCVTVPYYITHWSLLFFYLTPGE